MAKHHDTHADNAETHKDEIDSEHVGTISEQALSKVEAPTGAAPAAEPEGQRVRRHFMMKNFLPDANWVNKNVIPHGPGTKAIIGRIHGVCTSAKRQSNEYKGAMLESVSLLGTFECTNYITGEVTNPSVIYAPMAYSEKLETMFLADADLKVIEVDIDVGVEATGKSIPFEWLVIAFREGEEMGLMKRLRNSRSKPKNVLTAPGGDVLQLTGSAK